MGLEDRGGDNTIKIHCLHYELLNNNEPSSVKELGVCTACIGRQISESKPTWST